METETSPPCARTPEMMLATAVSDETVAVPPQVGVAAAAVGREDERELERLLAGRGHDRRQVRRVVVQRHDVRG